MSIEKLPAAHGLRGNWRTMRARWWIHVSFFQFFVMIKTEIGEVTLLDYAQSRILNPGEQPPFDPLDFESDIRERNFADEVSDKKFQI